VKPIDVENRAVNRRNEIARGESSDGVVKWTPRPGLKGGWDDCCNSDYERKNGGAVSQG
jgi:hypothetical protein